MSFRLRSTSRKSVTISGPSTVIHKLKDLKQECIWFFNLSILSKTTWEISPYNHRGKVQHLLLHVFSLTHLKPKDQLTRTTPLPGMSLVKNKKGSCCFHHPFFAKGSPGRKVWTSRYIRLLSSQWGRQCDFQRISLVLY